MSWVGGCRCGSWWWWLGGGSFWSLYSYEFIKTMFLFCLLFHTVMWTDILAGDDSNDEDDVETWDLMMRVSTSGWGPRLSGRCDVCRNHNTRTRARLSSRPNMEKISMKHVIINPADGDLNTAQEDTLLFPLVLCRYLYWHCFSVLRPALSDHHTGGWV